LNIFEYKLRKYVKQLNNNLLAFIITAIFKLETVSIAAAKPAACAKPLMLSTPGSKGKRGGRMR